MKKSLQITALVGVIAAGFAGTAGAVTVAGTGTGQFGADTCSNGVANCGAANNGKTLQLGGSNSGTDIFSTLTVNDQTFSSTFTTNVNDKVIGELTWINLASQNGDSNFTADYTFTLDFSAPTNLAAKTHTFSLNILQPTNPPGDSVLNMTNAGLALLGSFTLAGVTVSDLHFSTDGLGGSSYNSTTGAWYNPENNTSHLFITADFTAQATAVPEPASIALLGVGFLGISLIRNRRQSLVEN
jgi:hypothetical protein